MGRPEATRTSPRAVPWLARLSGSLGALSVAMGGNLVSADIGHRGVGIVASVAAVLAAAAWLRGFRPDFVLVVWVVRGCLLVAVAAVVTAPMVSATQSGVAVLVAALATLAATLIRSDPFDRLALLGAVVLIGLGAANVTAGVTAVLTGTGRFVTITMGVFSALLGVVALGRGRLLLDFVRTAVEMMLNHPLPLFYPLGGVFGFLGVITATHGDVLQAVVMFLLAIGAVGMTVGHGRRLPSLVGLSAAVAGAAWVLLGIWAITDGETLPGAAAGGLGVTIVVASGTYLSRRGVPGRFRSWLDGAKREA